MEFEILRDNLKNGLNIVERATGKNLTLPILNNVLIETKESFINLTCTDLEIAIISKNLAKIKKEGKIVVPTKLLLNLVSLLPNRKITLSLDNKNLFIECENFKSQIRTYNPEDFPIIPKIKTSEFIEIENKTFCEGVSQVVEVTSPSQIKPELSGVYFLFSDNLLKMVGTDSFRLAEKKIELEKRISKEFSFILPSKTVRELINILRDKNGKIKIFSSPNLVLFDFESKEISSFVQVTSKIIEGEYPNYQEIIPQKYKTKIILKREDFLNHIKTASLFSGRINEIKLSVQPPKNKVSLFAKTPETGESQSSLFGKVEGEKLETSFNYKFLVDGLLNIKSSEVTFELSDEEEPGVLKPVGDLSYVYVLMPIKTY